MPGAKSRRDSGGLGPMFPALKRRAIISRQTATVRLDLRQLGRRPDPHGSSFLADSPPAGSRPVQPRGPSALTKGGLGFHDVE